MDNQMFCFQCEQTAGCTGCTGKAGVCGKSASSAKLQDELTGALIALALSLIHIFITPMRVSCLVVINVFWMGAFSMMFSSRFVFYAVSIKEIK